MSLNDFKLNFFNHLENNSKDCYQDIHEFSDVIQKNFNEKGDIKLIRNFISEFNINVLNNKKKSFKLFEGVLKHPLFSYILKEFCNSEIMILACREGKEDVLKWLMTMNINTCVQDKNGRTALMYACKNPNLIKVVNYLCEHDKDNIHMIDCKGQNAAFYAADNIEAFRILFNHKINLNCTNSDYDTVLTYCCRNKIYTPFKTLLLDPSLDLNCFNNEEKTAAMYLIEDARPHELKQIINKKMILYYKNSKNETALTILFQKYKNYYKEQETLKLIPIVKIIKILIDHQINMNAIIDDEGNTPFMYFLMFKDWSSVTYALTHCPDLDLSYKNCYGENASLLCFEIIKNFRKPVDSMYNVNIRKLISVMIGRPSFDITYKDNEGNNLLMYSVFFNSIDIANCLLDTTQQAYETNNKNENALILSAKMGCSEIIKSHLLTHGFTDIDHQDMYGNTALHYAIQCQDYYIANTLAYYKANIYIKNKEGVSPLDLAKKDEKMEKLLKKPILPYKVNEKIKKSSYKPINKEVRDSFKEAFEVIMSLSEQKDGSISSFMNEFKDNTFMYEKFIRIYFTNQLTDFLGTDLYLYSVPGCENIITTVKRFHSNLYVEELVYGTP